MKRLLVATAVALLAVAAYFLAKPRKPEPPPAAKITMPMPVPPTATITNQVEVFKRAFWRPPAPGDKILHAERREWSDEAGVKKWQWFIAVEPSAELLKYVREDNAFGLAPTKAETIDKDAPAWFAFKSDEVDVLGSRGRLRLIFSKSGNTLYATDSGGGFNPGAPQPAKNASTGAVSTGRLPPTPPPVTR